METFEVIQPGSLTTIQDLGRYGYQQYGVPTSGAIDNYAFRIGNLLVNNDEGAASLEITLFGCQLRVLRDTAVAITGADLGAVLNSDPIPMWETLSICCGDIICFPNLKSGCRAYLSVPSGFYVPKVMASASTYTRARIGGLEGRALRKGDILQTVDSVYAVARARVPLQYIPKYSYQIELRVILGPQDNYFTEEGIRTFLNFDYTVSNQADRMGYRLDGPRIQHKGKTDILSDGIPLGTIQVPGDGLPIILLADRPTTGGYPKIGTVISIDIPKLAQAKPGDKVRFHQIKEDEAITELRQYEKQIEDIRHSLKNTAV